MVVTDLVMISIGMWLPPRDGEGIATSQRHRTHPQILH
jgi:hypothetical protein